jgi:hypothetical protein
MGARLSAMGEAIRNWYSAKVMPRWRALRTRATASRVGRAWGQMRARAVASRAGQRWAAMSRTQHRVIGAAGAMGVVLVIVAATLMGPLSGGGQGPGAGSSSSAIAAASPSVGSPTPVGSPTWTPWAAGSQTKASGWAPNSPVVAWSSPGSGSYRRPIVLAALDCPDPNSNPVASGGYLYIFCGESEVRAFDLATNALIQTYPVQFPSQRDYSCGPPGPCVGADLTGIVAVDHGLWVGWAEGGLQRLDLRTGKVTVNRPGWQLLADGLGYVWIGVPAGDEIFPRTDPYGINPSTGATAETLAAVYDGSISVACGLVWGHYPYEDMWHVLREYGDVLPWGGQDQFDHWWQARSPDPIIEIVEIGRDCWAKVVSSGGKEKLGRLVSNDVAASGIDLWSPELPADGDIQMLNGVPWFVRVSGSVTTMQVIDMGSLTPWGDTWLVPCFAPTYWQTRVTVYGAGDSYWCAGTAYGRTVLLRIAPPELPPGRTAVPPHSSPTPSPTPSRSPTLVPTPTATASPTAAPSPSTTASASSTGG